MERFCRAVFKGAELIVVWLPQPRSISKLETQKPNNQTAQQLRTPGARKKMAGEGKGTKSLFNELQKGCKRLGRRDIE